MQLTLIAAALLTNTGYYVLAAPANATVTSVNTTMATTDAPMATLNATILSDNTTAISTPTATNPSWAAQVSPIFPNMAVSPDAQPYINNGSIDINATLSRETLNLKNYPETWKTPDPKHPEVQAMVARLN
ncbi:hypothetical protein MAM1_0731d11161 [Mucor ambiguus]|uniref:Uncharacterized protein n=1 Tax=Mucor ambiguus TaxID=91626 RepID=A0A0C9N9Y9_9FUNG|nr:hypothetical protein MAM1_0731d11161 [Mucor ambiguus]